MNSLLKSRRSLNREWNKLDISISTIRARGTRGQITMPMLYVLELFTTFFILRNKNRDTISGILGLGDGEQTDKIMVYYDAGQFLEIIFVTCIMLDPRDQALQKKLDPFLKQHQIVLDRFLKKYKEDSNDARKNYVKRRFNSLFSTKTGYGELDHQIELTRAKER